jgi:hypothetical protein
MLTAASSAFETLDLGGVVVLVEAGVDLKTGTGRGRADQADDHLEGDKRLAAPVVADEAPQSVLDSVPLAGWSSPVPVDRGWVRRPWPFLKSS